MPMQWDTAADAKLFAAVVRVFDVKLANGVGEKLAKLMGPECNAKSIQNRFTTIRKRANELGEDGEEGGARVTKAKSTAKATKGKGGRKGKKAAAEASDDDDEEGAPPAKKQKKGKHEDGIEVGEDVGEGLRKTAKVKAEVKEDSDDEA
ncbi:hypothetical protein M409DRAFT_28875 [Zasmidium cellare ATCC 36951]|uniref:Uncharacterized protein n=1 Tax=Zasmidium cellare ATCC 36951 TaxID=1080233 RepID=A0A6A6C375_ZASCE|nr:uncharacterized protein M409DRAFT_28875 [Zasmidium cellare ATCC 36951]KAF2160738.1 hypothetical protein M409DRAFT_28875 [Zasmidium cellare ATCC 36951]